MADSFYRNNWNPFHPVHYPQAQIPPRSAKPKLINIPVHFVGSDGGASKQSSAPASSITSPKRISTAAAAISIQKAARGFLVRKNLRLVRQVAVEVDAIERKVGEEDEKIRVDPRERLRVSEELMALLLRVDSVRGVRDFRKKVIGRVIRLQEAIDSISDASGCKISAIDMADRGCPTGEASEEPLSSAIVHDQTLGLQQTEKPESGMEIDQQQTERPGSEMDIDQQQAAVSQDVTADLTMEADDTASKGRIAEGREESRSRAEESSLDIREERDKKFPDLTEEHESSKDHGEGALLAESSEEGRGLRKMMERMAADNENLKSLVVQLCENSAEQCRLMEGLADRVSHLERLAHHRKDRRKKRRNGSSYSALCSAK